MPKSLHFLLESAQILVFLLLVTPGFTQTLPEIEKDLVETYAQITSFHDSSSDSVEYHNKRFDQKIITYLEKHPNTLKYAFPQLSKECFVATSADGRFRIYSWDTFLGGTAPDFGSIIQYAAGDKVLISKLFVGPGFYAEIHTLKTRNKTYYIANRHNIFSTSDSGQSLLAYTIENGAVHPVELFKTVENLSKSVAFEFDFFSVVDHPERPLKLIKYDEKKKIFYLPVIADDGAVTELFTQYRFNGKYFEELK